VLARTQQGGPQTGVWECDCTGFLEGIRTTDNANSWPPANSVLGLQSKETAREVHGISQCIKGHSQHFHHSENCKEPRSLTSNQ
jgi:hypothetical protein